MKAVVNRVPLHPGRVELRQVSGQIYDLTRADEPTVIGDPLDHDLFARIQADIRDVTVRAGQSITAGDVVDIEDGEAWREVTAYDNVETAFFQNTEDVSVSALDNRSFIFGFNSDYNTHDSREFYIYICSVGENGEIKKETERLVASPVSYASCKALSANMAVAQYVQNTDSTLWAKLITNPKTAPSVGNNVKIADGTTNHNYMVPLSASKFAAIYNRSGLKIRICTVSGTTVAIGAEYALSGNTGAYRISACLLAANKIGICFADNAGKAVIATINGTAVTFGSVATFHSGADPYYVDCCEANGDIAVITGYANNSCVLAQVLSVSGTSISTATLECSIKSGDFGYYTKIRKVGGKLVALYYKRLESARACVLSRNGNALTKHDEYAYNGSAGVGGIDAAVLNDDTLAVCYADSGNSSYGTATILTVNGDQIAGSFEDTSSDAIALESGAPGQRIAVAKSGNVQLAGVKAGDRIDSPGVSAYAPLDGWLTVTAEEQGIRQGTYTGNGASYPDAREIILGFKPRIVLVVDDISVMAIITEKGLFGANSYNGANGAGYALAHKSGTGSKCTDKGFIVENTYYSGSYYGLNRNGVEYTYFVLA